jgi:eukaryotic-like serine/threonine-protein kinase
VNEESVFIAALDVPDPADRRAFLAAACRGDTALRARVELLLDADRHTAGILEHGPAAAVADPPLVAGHTLAGRYTLRRKVGEGGMGEVWAADQTDPVRRAVAVKLVRGGFDTARLFARFEQERQALARMDHPNVARVYDAGTVGPVSHLPADGRQDGILPHCDRPFVVMEFIDGVPITDYCDATKLSARRRVELFLSVCAAVQHAHQKGVIHRDLKPSNILVTVCDGSPVPKVIDFGVAKATGPRLTDDGLHTDAGTLVGTLEYMSPEQAELNNPDVDTRTDVYSLGVLLYELLSGRPPFTRREMAGRPLVEMLQVIRGQEPTRPSAQLSTAEGRQQVAANRGTDPERLVRTVRGELDWIVLKCLEKDRGRRYDTPAALADDLRRFLADEVVTARPSSAAYRVRKFVARNRGAVAAAAAVAFTLLAATVFSGWQAVRAREAEAAADADRRVAVAEARRADDEAAVAREVNAFLQDLLRQADIVHTPGAAGGHKHLSVREMLDRAAARIDGRFVGQERTEAELRKTLGKAYLSLGEYERAETHFRRALTLRQQLHGPDHRETHLATADLAAGLFARGKFAESEALLTSAWDGLCALSADSEPEPLAVLVNLANSDSRRGRWELAEERFRRVIAAYTAAYGETDRRTLAVQFHLAIHYNCAGDRRALAVAQQVADGFRATLGEEDVNTLRAEHYVGTVHLNARRYKEAEAVYLRVLKARQRALDPDHPELLTTLRDLGFVYLEWGRTDAAEPLFDKALARSDKLGPDHPITLELTSGRAGVLSKRKKYDEAEALFKHLVGRRGELFGPDAPDTLRSANNLGAHYLQRGLYAKAADQFRRAVEGAKRADLPPQHPWRRKWVGNLADAQGRLAFQLREQKKFPEAEAAARDCYDLLRSMKADAKRTFDARNILIDALLGQKKYDAAEPLALLAHEDLKRGVFKDDPARERNLRCDACTRLVALFAARGQSDKATEWKAKLAEARGE